jgi:hypothetical protein
MEQFLNQRCLDCMTDLQHKMGRPYQYNPYDVGSYNHISTPYGSCHFEDLLNGEPCICIVASSVYKGGGMLHNNPLPHDVYVSLLEWYKVWSSLFDNLKQWYNKE